METRQINQVQCQLRRCRRRRRPVIAVPKKLALATRHSFGLVVGANCGSLWINELQSIEMLIRVGHRQRVPVPIDLPSIGQHLAVLIYCRASACSNVSMPRDTASSPNHFGILSNPCFFLCDHNPIWQLFHCTLPVSVLQSCPDVPLYCQIACFHLLTYRRFNLALYLEC